MKAVLINILYWVIAVSLLTGVFSVCGYEPGDSVLLSLLFVPGCILLKFIIPKISFRHWREGVANIFFVICAVAFTVLLLAMIAHVRMYYAASYVHRYEMPHFLTDPVYVVLIVAVLSAGDHFLMRCFRHGDHSSDPISFTSDYKNIRLDASEIMYVESRDTEVWVHATEDRHFRNKTGITQWEHLLGENFIRVHRSYLVRKLSIAEVFSDSLILTDGTSVPVSRKYRDLVAGLR